MAANKLGVSVDRTASPGAQQSHLYSSFLAFSGVLTRRMTEAAWEVMGCLSAGRVLEIDPPTSKVICNQCWTTEKLGRNRNKLMEEKSAMESKIENQILEP